MVDRALAATFELDRHTLFQVSTSNALVQGVFRGAVTVADLKRNGDFGLGTFEAPRTPAFLNVPLPQGPREYSERTAQVIDEEIAKLLDEAHRRVTATLTTRRPALDALAKLLLEKEVVDRAALDQLLGRLTA